MAAGHLRIRRHPVAAVLTVVVALLGTGCGAQVQTPEPTNPLRHYVAIGDTFAAAPYAGATDRANGCRRAERNYPARLAAALKVRSFADATCTGADLRAATRKSKVRGHRLDPQIDAVRKSADLVTVQFGAYADGLYDNIASACAPESPSACHLAGAATLVSAVIAKVRQQLANVIRKVSDRAPHATVVVVGYPRHIDAKSSCRAVSGMTKADRTEWVAIDESLNLAVSRAARDTGADFVDVYAASKHHGICDKNPWVRPAVTDRSQGIALGPTAAGQAAVATLIRHTLRADARFDLE